MNLHDLLGVPVDVGTEHLLKRSNLPMIDQEAILKAHGDDDFCYLTTTGRVSGRPHTIEIWFALSDRTAYMLAGDHGSDWVKNLRKAPRVKLRLGNQVFETTARVVADPEEDALARRLVVAKYQPRDPSDDLSDWGRTALAVAIDL